MVRAGYERELPRFYEQTNLFAEVLKSEIGMLFQVIRSVKRCER